MIEVEDKLHNMDMVLEQLVGHGHANGDFIKLDNVFMFDVTHHNFHEYYDSESDERMQLFFRILMSWENVTRGAGRYSDEWNDTDEISKLRI